MHKHSHATAILLSILVVFLGSYIIWQQPVLHRNSPKTEQKQDAVSDTSGEYAYAEHHGSVQSPEYFEVRFSYPKGNFNTTTQDKNMEIRFGEHRGDGALGGTITVSRELLAADFCTNPKNHDRFLTLGFDVDDKTSLPAKSFGDQLCESGSGSSFRIPANFNFDQYVRQNTLSMVVGKYFVTITAPKETIQEIAKTFVFRPYFTQ